MEIPNTLLRWQLSLGSKVVVPFTRSVYVVGIRCIKIQISPSDHKPPPSIVHVIIFPRTSAPSLWINDKSYGTCLKTLLVKNNFELSDLFSGDTMELHEVDLTSSLYTHIC